MGKVILYIAQSIDGQIARKDGSVDWLNDYGDPNDYGMQSFMDKIGTIVWGSKTYEQSLGFGDWMFPTNIISYVMTRRTELPLVNDTIRLFNGTAPALTEKIKAECDMDIWLMGGADVITQFQNEGLIDELKIFVIPEVIGEGIPLWTKIEKPSKATLIGSTAYPNGVVELNYSLS
jgi:dihydrofolate reductase